jgi:hypothetical protein
VTAELAAPFTSVRPTEVQLSRMWRTTCIDESTAVLLLSPATRQFYRVPVRCRRLNNCADCREWEWERHHRHLDAVVKVPTLYFAEVTTDSQWASMFMQRKRTTKSVNYLWVLHGDGTRSVLADENLTPRSRRLQALPAGEALRACGRDYCRADAVKRRPTPRWKVPRRDKRISVGKVDRFDEAIAHTYPTGVPYEVDLGEAARVVKATLERLAGEG